MGNGVDLEDMSFEPFDFPEFVDSEEMSENLVTELEKSNEVEVDMEDSTEEPSLETLIEAEAKNETLSDAEELVDLEILVEEPTDHEVLIKTPEETVEKVTEKPKKAVLFKPSDKPIEPQLSLKAPLLIPSPTLSSHLQNVDPKNAENN